MVVPRFAWLGCFILALTVGVVAHGAVNKNRLVGTWEVTEGQLPKGSRLVFTAKGQFKLTVKVGDKTLMVEGKYEVTGNTLKTTAKTKDNIDFTNVSTITRLTNRELTTVDDAGKIEKYKKK